MELNTTNETDQSDQDKTAYHFGDHVHLVDEAFYIPQLNRYRSIWIYLPKSYKHSEKSYPVIYMHDAQNLFHATPARNDEWAVDSAIDSLIREGEKEMIVVGIENGGNSRLKEYNPYDSEYGNGEGKAYLRFIAETLKPFIDSSYRTLKDKSNTAIAGASMGALISTYALASYPGIFGSAGIFSPAYWAAPDIYDFVTAQAAQLQENKVFFVVGGKEGTEMVANTKKLYDILNPDGTNENITLVEKEDGKHVEWFWRREFVNFYHFIS